jgi:hypothetical protein
LARVKVVVGHEDLAADLDGDRLGELGGQPGDEAGLAGDVFPGAAVAAGDDLGEVAVDVAGGDRGAVDFRFDGVPGGRAAEDPVEAGRPGAQPGLVEDVVEAEHRLAVRDIAPARDASTAPSRSTGRRRPGRGRWPRSR